MNLQSLHNFLRGEAAGGVLLMFAAALALLVANSPLAGAYFDTLLTMVGPLSVLHWINDALMALFFLLVGLEIKREFIDGHLARWSDRALPVLSAVGGMAVPAGVYLLVTASTPGLARGWAIPAATDIAFAIGVMALLGKRVPTTLKLFLATVAIVDDMGAVVIIAMVYTAKIDLWAMLGALLVMGVMFGLNRGGVRRLWPYLLLAALLWLFVLLSGVHATVAGVLAAALVPIRAASASQPAPLHRLEHGLQPLVTYAIVPLFGFANAGVSFAGVAWADLLAPLPLAIALGLFLGKQAGVFGALWLCVRLGLAPRPAAGWAQIYGVCILCGIGFTMSLFIGGLAFADPELMDAVKMGVLAGSILSALSGYLLLRLTPRNAQNKEEERPWQQSARV